MVDNIYSWITGRYFSDNLSDSLSHPDELLFADHIISNFLIGCTPFEVQGKIFDPGWDIIVLIIWDWLLLNDFDCPR